MVTATIVSEFLRGARVISSHTGQNLFSSVVHLWRRNTRRYGGYIVHFGVAVAVIGLAGSVFNQTQEREMGNGDSMQIGKYTLVCRSYTQDDNANFGSASAIIDVFKNGRPLVTMYPERRFFKSSQQANTLPSVHSSLFEDLYLVYAGHNDTTDRPIITAHVNPLVGWFWTGWLILVLGTLLALVPNAAAVKVMQPVSARAIAPEVTMAQTTGAGD